MFFFAGRRFRPARRVADGCRYHSTPTKSSALRETIWPRRMDSTAGAAGEQANHVGLFCLPARNIPKGQSIRATVVDLELSWDNQYRKTETEASTMPVAEVYAAATAGFIRWLGALAMKQRIDAFRRRVANCANWH